jgi:hypothetical protein
MDNTDLIMLLGFGLTSTSLAVVLPPTPSRPAWLPMLLGIVGAVLGLLAALTVLFR